MPSRFAPARPLLAREICPPLLFPGDSARAGSAGGLPLPSAPQRAEVCPAHARHMAALQRAPDWRSTGIGRALGVRHVPGYHTRPPPRRSWNQCDSGATVSPTRVAGRGQAHTQDCLSHVGQGSEASVYWASLTARLSLPPTSGHPTLREARPPARSPNYPPTRALACRCTEVSVGACVHARACELQTDRPRRKGPRAEAERPLQEPVPGTWVARPGRRGQAGGLLGPRPTQSLRGVWVVGVWVTGRSVTGHPCPGRRKGAVPVGRRRPREDRVLRRWPRRRQTLPLCSPGARSG